MQRSDDQEQETWCSKQIARNLFDSSLDAADAVRVCILDAVRALLGQTFSADERGRSVYNYRIKTGSQQAFKGGLKSARYVCRSEVRAARGAPASSAIVTISGQVIMAAPSEKKAKVDLADEESYLVRATFKADDKVMRGALLH